MAKRQQERYRRMKVTKPRDVSAKAIGKSLVAGSLGMPADLAQMAMMAQPGAMMSPTVREATDKMPLTSEKIAQSMDVDTKSPEFLTGSVLAPGPPGSSAVKLAKAGTVAKNLAGALPVVGSMKKVFTSPAVKAVSEIKQNKMPANQWISQMKSRGVKQDELTWTGVEDWLKSQDKSVTKQDLDEYLEANQIQVQEVVKGVASGNAKEQVIRSEVADELTRIMDNDESLYLMRDSIEDAIEQYRQQGDLEVVKELNKIFEDYRDVDADEFAIPTLRRKYVEYFNRNPREFERLAGGETKYGQYTLPGGENYRELLLTLPSKKMVDPVKRYEELNDILARRNLTDAEQAEMVAIERQQFNQESGTVGRDFVSGHYDEPNIVAHIRFNERVDADGNKVLFIEEIQSDWAQSGRKRGFSPADRDIDQEITDINKELSEVSQVIDTLDSQYRNAEIDVFERNKRYLPLKEEYEALLEKRSELVEQIKAVPDAPFVMDTNQWTSLALKRMVRWATDNDFDQIAWTTGKQQAKRYDLSKQVDAIRVTQESEVGGPIKDTYQIIARPKGGGEMVEVARGVSAEKMSDYVGKELTEKVLKTIETDKAEQLAQGVDYYPVAHEFTGVDLEVGGEGMGAFYDKILVDRAKKLGKQYGSKVEKGNIIADDFEYEIQEVFPETYQVRYPSRDGGFEINEFATMEEAEEFAEGFGEVMQQKTEVWTMNLTDKLKKAAKDGLPYYVALPPIVAGVASQQAEASEVKKPAVQVKSNRIMEEAMP